ncbi:MAG: C10 family peptidase [Muribaculaceae bacterium]|nr:C10 family peptidase [Muribaculaceae bacterium]
MKRLVLSTLILAVGLLSAMAAKITQERALEISQSFLSSHKGTRSAHEYSDLLIENYKDALFIINNPSGGWVLVGADDSLPQPVLGYSDQGRLSIENMAAGARWLLDEYVSGIVALGRNNLTASAPSATGKSAEPLLGEISWDQYEPYNDRFPILNGVKTVAGCTNIAEGQIMRYHQHPARGKGSFSYTWEGVEYSADFGKSEYNWDLMKPQYTGEESKEERDAVAAFIYDLAISNESAFGSATGAGFWVERFVEIFNYDKSLRRIDRSLCCREDYERIMREEIDAGRPIYVSGGSAGGAHAFVCDGYDAEGYFHYNFGWGPHNNAYLLSTATGFDASQSLVVSIMPEQGGLPGVWAGSSDDFINSGKDNISCNIDGSIILQIPADIEVALAVENKQDGNIDYLQKKVFKNSTNFSVSGFSFSDKVEDGTYNLYPVYHVVGNSEWEKVCFADNCANHVEVEVKNGEKTYTNVGVGGVADDDVIEIEGVFYRIYENEAKVTRRNSRGNCYKGDVVIPAEIEYQGEIYPVTAIGEYAFKNSRDVNSLTIGKNVKELEFASFSDCNIKSLNFAEGSEIKSIGGWAFNGCTVPELRFPSGLESIGMCALRGNIKLLDIPETLTILWSEAISSMDLKDVYVHWKEESALPEYMDWSISSNTDEATLHVPAGCKDLYSNHDLWKAFPNIVEDSSGVKNIKDGDSDIRVIVGNGSISFESTEKDVIGQIYSAQGVKVGNVISGQYLNVGSGVFIIKIKDKVFKVML